MSASPSSLPAPAGAAGLRAFELPPLEAPPGLAAFSAAVAAPPVPAIDLEAEAAAARGAGHAEGFAAGHAEALAQVAPLLGLLQEAAAGVAAERERVSAAVEVEAVRLALGIAEQAIAGALDADPGRVVDVVRGALRRLVERERVTVLVHPEDLELVRAATAALIGQLGGMEHLEVQAERRVARGGAIVRTTDGDVDASVATKLARVRELLAEDLGADLGAPLPAAAPAADALAVEPLAAPEVRLAVPADVSAGG